MHSKTFLAVFALATAVAAAPVPNHQRGSSPPNESWGQEISNILGSPFGNGNLDGNVNVAGSGDSNNASGNGDGSGDKNGNGNVFGNGNDISVPISIQ